MAGPSAVGIDPLLAAGRRVRERQVGEGQVHVPAPVLDRPDKAESVIYVDLYVTARLTSFKVPEIVEFRDEPLPRNPAGKLLKNKLRDKRGAGGQP
jgi:acyl-CoA synthetase (AMP-forming)/AMP-acid ligase II